MRALMWFRSDLRTRDNPALRTACARAADGPGGGVVAVFVVCGEQWKAEHDWGGAKVGFLLANLRELSDRLAKLNIPLKILRVPRFDGVAEALGDLARDVEAACLCFNREHEVNERRRDEAVESAFRKLGLGVHACTDQVVFAPGTVRTKEDKAYTVFSPFKRRWIERWTHGSPPASEDAPKRQHATRRRRGTRCRGSVDGFDLDAYRDDLWQPGETHAARPARQLHRAARSGLRRSEGHPECERDEHDEPVPRARRRQRAAVPGRGGGGRTTGTCTTGRGGLDTWISELIWREFYRHVLVAFPRVSMHRAFRPEMDRVGWRDDDEGFDAWCEGRTGYPIVDAGMRQLRQTGWMHNRLRMIVAMFLTKHLLIDWRRGEAYFMRHLIDGDLASNNGGWQWSASTGTDAQPYFRIFNPTTQGERFDKDGSFIRKFVPELSELKGKAIHSPREAGLFDKLDYPEPIVEHKKARERALEAFKAVAKG
jgi:deoxyribodipyrimidine photo-lyase